MRNIQLGVLVAMFCSMTACGSVEQQATMQKTANQTPPVPTGPGEPDDARGRLPPPELGGQLVRGSEVFLPRSAEAGGTVEGRAPAGSTVEFQGQRVTVKRGGVYELTVPRDATGSLPVRIERPGDSPVVLQLRIEAD